MPAGGMRQQRPVHNHTCAICGVEFQCDSLVAGCKGKTQLQDVVCGNHVPVVT